MRRVALALAALLAPLFAASPGVAAEPLAAGWSLHRDVGKPGGFTPNGLACGRGVAALRAWAGEVQTFDGARWAQLPRLPGWNLGKTYGDAIAIGDDGAIYVEATGAIGRWDGKDWASLPLPGWVGPIAGLAALPSGDLVVVGTARVGVLKGGSIASYAAGTWRELTAVTGTSLTELWTAGQGGTVMHHTSGGWRREATASQAWLAGLALVAPDDLWAWGSGGSTPAVLRRRGGAWASASTGLKKPLLGLAGGSSGLWAATADELVRFDGSAWVSEVATTTLGPGYHRLVGLCNAGAFLLAADAGGHALVRSAPP